MACLRVLSRSKLLRPNRHASPAPLRPLIGAAAARFSYITSQLRTGTGNDFSYMSTVSTGGGAMAGHASQAPPFDSFVFAGQNRVSGLETIGDVYGQTFRFLWDTGASGSSIDLKVVDKLNLRYDKKVRHLIGVIDNSEFVTLGVCRIVWMMGGVRYAHQFDVIHGEGSLLLGTDFMRRFSTISFYFKEREIIAVKKNKTIKFSCV